jgi:hypothetical protein
MAGYELTFEKIATGRTHTTREGVAEILNEDGTPETEYVLFAHVDGAKLRLLSKSSGYVERQVERAQNAADNEPDDEF